MEYLGAVGLMLLAALGWVIEGIGKILNGVVSVEFLVLMVFIVLLVNVFLFFRTVEKMSKNLGAISQNISDIRQALGRKDESVDGEKESHLKTIADTLGYISSSLHNININR